MASDFSRDVHCLLGLPFDAVDLAGAVARVHAAQAGRRACAVATPNLDFVAACLADPAFRATVIDSDLSLADGMPLVWTARCLGLPIRERVAGATLFEALRRHRERRLAVYFFGGGEGVAEAACRRLNAAEEGLVAVGGHCPGFGSVEDMSGPEHLEKINASGADFLVLSLGARKGQAWIGRNRERIRPPLVSHLGAVVNFVAGTVRRAPAWMQRSGLEWLWRIREEPALWRRYARDGAIFARLFLTRVLPHAWFLRRHAPSPRELAAASLQTEATPTRAIVRLRGPWTGANLPRFRACLTGPFLAGRDLQLDLQAATYLDSACVGLLLLLSGHQRRQGRRLRLDPVAPPVRRILRYGCAEFLLEAT